MAFAQGSRSALRYAPETSFGVLPTTPVVSEVPIRGHDIQLTKERVAGADILSDRMPRVDRHGNRQVAGPIEVDMRDTAYDWLIESAMFNTFVTANTIEIGNTPQFFTIEDAQLDITQYRQFAGCLVNTWNLTSRPNEMVRSTFTVAGQDVTQTATPLDATPTEVIEFDPFDSYNGPISEGGLTVSNLLSFEFTLNNNAEPAFVLGSDKAPQMQYGRATIEGTFTAYYEDATYINKFLNETESELTVVLDDPVSGSTYTLFFPRTKINGAAVPVDGQLSRIITIPFIALYDSGEGTMFRITKG